MNRYPWSIEEEYLLVDIYTQYKDTPNMGKAIIDLSNLLRDYGKALGRDVYAQYRNQTGIRMKLMNIAFVVSGGKTGLSCTSKLDEDIVKEYFKNPSSFHEMAQELVKTIEEVIESYNKTGAIAAGVSTDSLNRKTSNKTQNDEVSNNMLNNNETPRPAWLICRGEDPKKEIECYKQNIEFYEKSGLPAPQDLLDELNNLEEETAFEKVLFNAENKSLLRDSLDEKGNEDTSLFDASEGKIVYIKNLDVSQRLKNVLLKEGIWSVNILSVCFYEFKNTLLCTDNILNEAFELIKKYFPMRARVIKRRYIDAKTLPSPYMQKEQEPSITNKKENEPKESIEVPDLSIHYISMSVRLKKVLLRNNILCLKDMIALTIDEVKQFKNIGKKSVDEFISIVDAFAPYANHLTEDLPNKLINIQTEIAGMHFSVHTYNLLIQNDITTFYALAQLTDNVVESWKGAGHKSINEIKQARELAIRKDVTLQPKIVVNQLKLIHSSNEKYAVEIFFNKINTDKLKSKGIFLIKDLKACDENDILSLDVPCTLILTICRKLKDDFIQSFRKQFDDIIKKRKKSGEPSQGWEREYEIIINRAFGMTLKDIGQIYGITRERVRQIVKKYIDRFDELYKNNKTFINQMLKAFSRENACFTTEEICKLIGKYEQAFTYGLKQSQDCDIIYIEELDVFYIPDDIDWYSEMIETATGLPDTIMDRDLNEAIDKIYTALTELDINIPYEFCEIIIKQDFKENGDVWTRYKLSLAKKYVMIIEKHYPNGIDVYDPSTMTEFKKHYNNMFGDGLIPDNDRAIYSRIADVCIVCGKGRYKLKQKEYISQLLVDDIYQYIMESDKDLFLITALLHVFADRLSAEGVNNRYYLQGILKQAYKNLPLYFSKDYISKNPTFSTIAKEIAKQVIEAGDFVSYDSLKEEYPGIADSIFAAVGGGDEIIYYGNYYISAKALMKKNETVIIDEVASQMVSDGEIHNTADLYNYLALMNGDVIENLKINNKYSLASILIKLYEDKYEVRRPFFARKGITIPNNVEMIQSITEDRGEVEIDEIMGYVYDNGLHHWNMIDVINSIDGYVLKNKTTLIKEELLGINKYMISDIEDALNDIAKDDIAVPSQTKVCVILPKLTIPWNEWLLYSIIFKHSSEYKPILSNAQFKLSIPIFLKKSINANNIEELYVHLKKVIGLSEEQLVLYLKDRGILG